ncbi:AraC family transcriptional regulator [bacterium]|nr:AraC family transcriptional regulator [bacterium]
MPRREVPSVILFPARSAKAPPRTPFIRMFCGADSRHRLDAREGWLTVSNVPDELLPVDIDYFGVSHWRSGDGTEQTRPDNYSLHFVVAGAASLSVNGVRMAVREGDMYVVPPFARYRCVADGPETFSRMFLVLYPHSTGALRRFGLDRVALLRLPARDADAAKALLDRMKETVRSDRDDIKYLCSAWAYELLIIVARAARRARRRAAMPERLEAAMWRVRRAFDQPWKVADLARAAGCSVVHLNRLFRRHLGASAHHWLERARIDHAKLLLMNSTLPVNAIAARAGYVDPYYFSTAFKRVMGASPTRYRALHSRR